MELKSIFKDEINLLIKYEKAIGIKRNNEENYKKLDTYFVKIKKEEKNLTELEYYDFIYYFNLISNIKVRYIVIRNFAQFLINNNYINVFIEDVTISKDEFYEPHLYTEEEMKNIFKVTDARSKDDIKKAPFSILFRLLFSSGLRIGEALRIRVSDINYDNKSVQIMHSKFDHNRLIFLSDSMHLSLKNYISKMKLKDEDKIFLNLSEVSCLREFKKVVSEANIKIEHVVLHDLRHSFAVIALNKYLKNNNQNYEEAYAYLQHYLGHGSVNSTEYYLHMTNENMKEIVEASIIKEETHE